MDLAVAQAVAVSMARATTQVVAVFTARAVAQVVEVSMARALKAAIISNLAKVINSSSNPGTRVTQSSYTVGSTTCSPLVYAKGIRSFIRGLSMPLSRRSHVI